jgi:hypothetical protein
MTRLWLGVDPAGLCDQHLLGEHSEMHQEVGTWLRHPHGEAVVEGHVSKLQVVPGEIRERHDALAEEMARREFNHNSPLEDFDAGEMPDVAGATLDEIRDLNRSDLDDRCNDCEAGAA